MVKHFIFILLAGVNSMQTNLRPREGTCEYYLQQISDDYQCPEKVQIGSGSFGAVFKVVRKSDQANFAMKVIKWDEEEDLKKFASKVDMEIWAMKACDHPNVIKLIDHKKVFKNERLSHAILIMEYAENGNLKQWIKKRFDSKQSDDLKEPMQYLLQIAEGLNHIHSKKLVHRDIKPDNIGISNGVAKILDFGLACGSEQKFSSIAGTPSYVDPFPFTLARSDINTFPWRAASDVYSLGVLFWEMLFSVPLLYRKSRIGENGRFCAAKNEIYTLPSGSDETAAYLVSRMFLFDPDQRITLPEIIKEIKDYLAAEVHPKIKKTDLDHRTPFTRSDSTRLHPSRWLSLSRNPSNPSARSNKLSSFWPQSRPLLVI